MILKFNVMKIAISQPTYFPWLGQFDLIDQSDIFIFYDDVQVVKQSWGTRNRIKTHNDIQWLSVGIKHNKNFSKLEFNTTELNNINNWRIKHLKTIKNSYIKSKYFEEIYDWLNPLILDSKYNFLGDFNINIIKSICFRIGINSFFKRSSMLNSKDGSKDERLVSICKELEAETYISPIGAFNYIEKNNKYGNFEKSETKLIYQDYKHPEYNQLYGNFVSHLSILDLLFNEGFNNSLDVIRSGRGILEY